jgi:hypothetical protein
MYAKQSIGTRLFVDSIVADRPIESDFHAGGRTQMVIDAAFESNRSGCWEEMPHRS